MGSTKSFEGLQYGDFPARDHVSFAKLMERALAKEEIRRQAEEQGGNTDQMEASEMATLALANLLNGTGFYDRGSMSPFELTTKDADGVESEMSQVNGVIQSIIESGESELDILLAKDYVKIINILREAMTRATRKDVEKLLKKVEDPERLSKPDIVRLIWQRFTFHSSDQRFDEVLLQILLRRYDSKKAYASLARFYENNNHPMLAEVTLKRGLTDNPHSARLTFHLLKLYLAQDREADAKDLVIHYKGSQAEVLWGEVEAVYKECIIPANADEWVALLNEAQHHVIEDSEPKSFSPEELRPLVLLGLKKELEGEGLLVDGDFTVNFELNYADRQQIERLIEKAILYEFVSQGDTSLKSEKVDHIAAIVEILKSRMTH